MKNNNTLIVEDFDLTMQLYQFLYIAIILLLVFIFFVTVKKVWRFLDKANKYLDNKNSSFNNE